MRASARAPSSFRGGRRPAGSPGRRLAVSASWCSWPRVCRPVLPARVLSTPHRVRRCSAVSHSTLAPRSQSTFPLARPKLARNRRPLTCTRRRPRARGAGHARSLRPRGGGCDLGLVGRNRPSSRRSQRHRSRRASRRRWLHRLPRSRRPLRSPRRRARGSSSDGPDDRPRDSLPLTVVRWRATGAPGGPLRGDGCPVRRRLQVAASHAANGGPGRHPRPVRRARSDDRCRRDR